MQKNKISSLKKKKYEERLKKLNAFSLVSPDMSRDCLKGERDYKASCFEF